MQVIAHRGANKEALENSFSAFDIAIEVGATKLEFDIQETKDHHAVVMHDESLLRLTGVRANTSDLTRAEISKIKLTNGEDIPFLDDMLERYLELESPIELNIEVKGESPTLARAAADLTSNHRCRDRIIFSGFQWVPMQELMQIAPDVRRACLWGIDSFSWPFFANLAPQVFMERIDAKVIHPAVHLVDESLMEMAEQRGWEVFPWCAMKGEEKDREGVWATLYTYDVDGLCTNYPRQFKYWLEQANQEVSEHKKEMDLTE